MLYGFGTYVGEVLFGGDRTGSMMVILNYPSALLAGWIATLGVTLGLPSPSDAVSIILVLACDGLLGAVVALAIGRRRPVVPHPKAAKKSVAVVRRPSPKRRSSSR